jgi:hypothetical protein
MNPVKKSPGYLQSSKNIQNANDNTQRMYWADAFEKLICEHF